MPPAQGAGGSAEVPAACLSPHQAQIAFYFLFLFFFFFGGGSSHLGSALSPWGGRGLLLPPSPRFSAAALPEPEGQKKGNLAPPQPDPPRSLLVGIVVLRLQPGARGEAEGLGAPPLRLSARSDCLKKN